MFDRKFQKKNCAFAMSNFPSKILHVVRIFYPKKRLKCFCWEKFMFSNIFHLSIAMSKLRHFFSDKNMLLKVVTNTDFFGLFVIA